MAAGVADAAEARPSMRAAAPTAADRERRTFMKELPVEDAMPSADRLGHPESVASPGGPVT
ncbi:hypothetical protein GCM10009544_21940 [Streptomyces stramineus]|uniref:Uncharacterized protein n=1 Tax=Streptomyces stramineus TaxID=173861 RepID=A0ABP3JMZ6_9ACTN